MSRTYSYEAAILVFLFGFAIGSVPLFSQTTGLVTGTVTDQRGVVIPEVSLRLKNVNTGETRTVVSSTTGDYDFNLIAPGTYDLVAEKSGFAMVTVTGLVVRVNTPLHRDITMEVGQLAQEVTVQATPVVVNVEDASLGEVIGSQQSVALPLNGRNFLQLATLSVGVVPPTIQNSESVATSNAGGRSTVSVSISGNREISPDFLFDGIPSRLESTGPVGLEPSVDSIAEFSIQRGYFSPQFGKPAVVNVVTKSGNNDFHGAAWEFLRNDLLDARNFFDASKAPLRQNQFGVNAGGPIVKNKLFFFGEYEQLLARVSTTSYARVPTAEMLQGDLSALLPGTVIVDPVTKEPFTNNQIPATQISDLAKTYIQQELIPAPNTAPIPERGGANLRGITQRKQDDLKVGGRVDFKRSEQDTFFSRFSFLNSDLDTTSLVPLAGRVNPKRVWNGVVAWTHVFNSALVNDARIGLDRVFLSVLRPEKSTESPHWPTVFDLRNLNAIPECNSVPSAGLAGYVTLGGNTSCLIPSNTNIHVINNLAYIRGRHNITTGFQIVRVNQRNIASFNTNGSFNFNGQFSRNSVADFLLGAAASVGGASAQTPFYLYGWWPDVYFNDDFHVSRKLTLNLGLRWQFTQPLPEKNDNLFKFDFETGTMARAGTEGIPRGVVSSHYMDFAPRIGIAYALGTDMALRSSYGVFWDRAPGNEVGYNGLNWPLVTSFAATSELSRPTIDLSNLFPDPGPATGGTPPPGTSLFNYLGEQNPYFQQWTLSLQRTFRSSIFTEIAYIGSKGTHLSKRIDANSARLQNPGENLPLNARRPYPNLSFILSDQSRGNSSYNSLQLTVRKSYSTGFSFLTGYTWSKSLDNDSFDGKGARNSQPGDMDKGRSVFDVRHLWVSSFSYELPFARNATGVARQLVGGWRLSGILSMASGLPFHSLSSVDYSNTANFGGSRPNRLCNGNLPSEQRTPQRWFDTSCFAFAALNTFGNGGVHYLDVDGTRNVDFAISKNFRLSETGPGLVEFRSEFFNAFNNVNFGRPGNSFGTPAFGVVTTALPGRIIQFGLKVLW